MKFIYILILFALTSPLFSEDKVPQKAEWTSKHFFFDINHEKGDWVNFGVFSLKWTKTGYSVKVTKTDKVIATDVFYVKTFGGEPPAIAILLVNDRFLMFPETVPNSEQRGTLHNKMKAKTHIYDIKSKIIVSTSPEYTYEHDAPLRYNIRLLRVFARSALLTKP